MVRHKPTIAVNALAAGGRVDRAQPRRKFVKRYLVSIGAALLAVSLFGSISAQTGIPVNADGSYVVASDDGAPIVEGAGDDFVVGDVSTGGQDGQILGDPNAVYSPNVPDTRSLDGGVPVVPGAGDGLIGGVPILRPVPTAPDATTLTTSNLVSTEGTATENIPVDAAAPVDAAPPAESAPVATDTVTAAGGFCSQYATWYDAQIAYENLGATAADPALVEEVDPNYDGIACEAMMV
jgi:hypothetical protein